MEKQKNNDLPIHIYEPSAWMQLGLGLILIFIVIHFSVIMQAGFGASAWSLIFIPFYAFMIWMIMISSSQSHLAIYDDGLEYRMGNNRIFSTWEDLSYFEMRPSGKTRIAGIYTVHLQKRQEGNFLEKLLLSNHKNFIPLSGIVSVPTRWDGCWTGAVVDSEKFRYTEFGSNLYHYAPHLFEVQKEKAKNS